MYAVQFFSSNSIDRSQSCFLFGNLPVNSPRVYIHVGTVVSKARMVRKTPGITHISHNRAIVAIDIDDFLVITLFVVMVEMRSACST